MKRKEKNNNILTSYWILFCIGLYYFLLGNYAVTKSAQYVWAVSFTSSNDLFLRIASLLYCISWVALLIATLIGFHSFNRCKLFNIANLFFLIISAIVIVNTRAYNHTQP